MFNILESQRENISLIIIYKLLKNKGKLLLLCSVVILGPSAMAVQELPAKDPIDTVLLIKNSGLRAQIPR